MASITNKILQSSSLLIASKMLQRFIGLVSIMILARLITPDDFAIVALTAIIIYFFDMLSNVGTEQYIIQKEHVTYQDLNTAWTIDLITKCTLWFILIISASFISDYFKKPELQSAIYIMSFLLPLNALKNPGTLLLKSELNYKALFWLSAIQKFISFIVVIVIAYLAPSYWALIIADLVASTIFLIGSYKIHNFRPNLSLTNSNEQWLFSKWLLLKGIVGYIRSQIDTLFVSKFFPANILGQYYMVRNLAMLPAHNIFTPAIEPMLAAYKDFRHSSLELTQKVRISIFIMAIFTIPVCFFVWYFPQPLIDSILGKRWHSSYSMLSSMALLIAYFPFILILEQLLLVKQKVKFLFFFDVISLLLIVVGLIFISLSSIERLAIFRGGAGIISTFIMMIYIHYVHKIKTLQSLVFFIPIIIACSGAAHFTLNFIQPVFDWPIVNLAYQGSAFILFYLLFVSTLMALMFKNSDEVKFIIRLFYKLKYSVT
jgi:O-antigen/teichoic acid export membrane protein